MGLKVSELDETGADTEDFRDLINHHGYIGTAEQGLTVDMVKDAALKVLWAEFLVKYVELIAVADKIDKHFGIRR